MKPFYSPLLRITFLISILPVIYSCQSPSDQNVQFRSKEIDKTAYEMTYTVGNWEHPSYGEPFESNGNHRILIETPPGASLVQVRIPWRRPDDPANKAIFVFDTTGMHRMPSYTLSADNGSGHILFRPMKDINRYFVYYLPHRSTGGYYPKLEYIAPDTLTLPEFLGGVDDPALVEQLPEARVIQAESIDAFHSFFPMEIVATPEEVANLSNGSSADYLVFPEYRDHPIRMNDFLPLRWVIQGVGVNGLRDEVRKDEYYTFQVGVYPLKSSINGLDLSYSDLSGNAGTISSEAFTCFNTEGIDLDGQPFSKEITLPKDRLQALWFGLQVPADAQEGVYRGSVILKPHGSVADTVFLELTVLDETIENHGDDDPERMTRLRWLNSTIGTDPNEILKPFEPITVEGNKMNLLGRSVELNGAGLPTAIDTYFSDELTGVGTVPKQVFSDPAGFNVIDAKGNEVIWEEGTPSIDQPYPGEVRWNTVNRNKWLDMILDGSLEYDGTLILDIDLVAKQSVKINDIRLDLSLSADAAKYILGLGRKGGRLTDQINWKWDITRHQEGAWIGDYDRGLQFVLRDKDYVRPLNTNFYQNQPLILPDGWYNGGKGGIDIVPGEEQVSVSAYSGARELNEGDTLNFIVRFLITPFKPLELQRHFSTRFVHKYVPVDSAVELNGTVINVHHANEINPYINYPFYNLDEQKAYIDEAHSKGVKVKLYNTIRELTYRSHELFAMRSLDDEIFNTGEGGGHSWLQEHLRKDYHSAWHAWRVNDAAILNKGISRWTNYYIEGINWLAQNQEIDGLYLDDIAFSRSTVKRIVSVLENHREDFIIDLHSANQFNPRDGFTNSAFLYMEHFPYITRLWFGEYFEYDLGPDYWLTEVSGIPFGLNGEMLEKGGHPYRGLVYGMTTRVYGEYNPQNIWQLFDDFGIEDSRMLGYWMKNPPITVDHPDLRCTTYLKEDKAMVAIGSWAASEVKTDLQVNWEQMNLDPASSRIFAPEIPGLQEYREFGSSSGIRVPAQQGLILIIEGNE